MTPFAQLNRTCTLVLATVALLLARAEAAEIKGTVRSVSGSTATVAVEGASMPSVGDKADIFFKLAGAEDEISVASASVVKVDGDAIQLKIEKATGDVAKDQQVRITSDKPQKREARAVSVPSPVETRSEEALRASLVGRWAGKTRDGLQATVIFKGDGTLIIPLQQIEGALVSGKYSIDFSSNPPRVVITNIEVRPPPQWGEKGTKTFQEALEEVRQVKPLPPFAGPRLNHLREPVRDALLRSTWIAEIDDPTHIRIQGFSETESAARPKLGPEAGTLTKLGLDDEGPIADIHPLPPSNPVPSVLPTPSEAYNNLMAEAISHSREGDIDGAIASYTRLIELEPNGEVSAWYNRAQEYEKKGEWAKALDDLTHLILVKPTYLAYRRRAEVRIRMGQWTPELLADCNKAIELDEDAEAYVLRARYFEKAGRKEAAEADYKKALSLGPSLEKWVNRVKSGEWEKPTKPEPPKRR
jgi:tetratricopeptide (TPR) repeat protein